MSWRQCNQGADSLHRFAGLLRLTGEVCVLQLLLLLQVQRLGVCSVLVPTSIGLCCKTFKEGLEKYAAQHAGS